MQSLGWLFVILLLLWAPARAMDPEWRMVHSPTSDDLNALWGASEHDIYAAGGYDTTLLHFEGALWNDIEYQLPPLATADTYGIWGTSATNIYTVGGWSFMGLDKGNILNYNGSRWRSLTAAPNSFLSWTNVLYSLWGSSETAFYAVGRRSFAIPRLDWVGPLLYYDGSRMVEMSNPREHLEGSDLYDIWGTSSNDIFAAGRAVKETCSDWDCFFGFFCQCIDYEDFEFSSVMHFDGSRWQMMETGINADIYGIWGSSPDRVFAVGEAGTILYYNGTAWSDLVSGTTAQLNDVWGTSPDDVFSVGGGGTILHYDGLTWSSMQSPTESTLNAVWGTASDRVYAVGADGTILIYTHLLDYGDAPDPGYPAYLFSDGARHSFTDVAWLGDGVSAEPDSNQLSIDQHDDGIYFLGSSPVSGGPYSLPYASGQFGAVRVTVGGDPGISGYLHGWIDWNGDGTWDSPDDNIFCGYEVSGPGETVIEFSIPESITSSCTWARFRLDLDENLCSVTGLAAYGEVEDYEICPTLIILKSFTATPADGSVIISWETESEVNNTGFNLYRSESSDGGYGMLNDSLIVSTGSPGQGAVYRFIDNRVANGTLYYYILEDLDVKGKTTRHGPVSAAPESDELNCYAVNDLEITRSLPSISGQDENAGSCYSNIVLENPGRHDIDVYWHTTDTYSGEDLWNGASLAPGETFVSEEPAWGYIFNHDYNFTRRIVTSDLTAFYSGGEYADSCSWIGESIINNGTPDASVRTTSVQHLDPCGH